MPTFSLTFRTPSAGVWENTSPVFRQSGRMGCGPFFRSFLMPSVPVASPPVNTGAHGRAHASLCLVAAIPMAPLGSFPLASHSTSGSCIEYIFPLVCFPWVNIRSKRMRVLVTQTGRLRASQETTGTTLDAHLRTWGLFERRGHRSTSRRATGPGPAEVAPPACPPGASS